MIISPHQHRLHPGPRATWLPSPQPGQTPVQARAGETGRVRLYMLPPALALTHRPLPCSWTHSYVLPQTAAAGCCLTFRRSRSMSPGLGSSFLVDSVTRPRSKSRLKIKTLISSPTLNTWRGHGTRQAVGEAGQWAQAHDHMIITLYCHPQSGASDNTRQTHWQAGRRASGQGSAGVRPSAAHTSRQLHTRLQQKPGHQPHVPRPRC